MKYPDGSFSTRVLGSDIVGPEGPAYPYYQGIADKLTRVAPFILQQVSAEPAGFPIMSVLPPAFGRSR